MTTKDAPSPPKRPPPASGPIHMTVTSTPKSLPVVRGAVERMAQTEGFGEDDAHAVTLATDEAVTNVIRHGYGNQPHQPIHLTLEPVRAEDGRAGLRITIRDYGRQVDPAAIRGRDLDDIRPGGLGVHMIRTVMDRVEYSRPRDGGMQLRMVKYVSRPAESGDRPTSEASFDVRRKE